MEMEMQQKLTEFEVSSAITSLRPCKKIKSESQTVVQQSLGTKGELPNETVAKIPKCTFSFFESKPHPLKIEDASCSNSMRHKFEEAISCPDPLSLSHSLSPMVPEKLTEYERRRLENIKRNTEMLSFLQVQPKLAEFSSLIKAQRAQVKSYKASLPQPIKRKTRTVIRQSLRTRGKPPDASTAGGLKKYYEESVAKDPKWKQSLLELGPNPFSMKDANCSGSSDTKLTEIILGASKKSVDSECSLRVSDTFDWTSLRLETDNVAKVVPARIMVAKFFPSMDISMISVGNKQGDIGFWHFNGEKEDGDRIYLYRPHPGRVSGITIHPFSLSKVYSSCYDGFIRLMDVNKEVFESIYSSDYQVYSLSHQQSDANSLYFGEGRGIFHIWDTRKGKSSMSCSLHGHGITSIDFSSENTNIMATSSRDKTACIWDLRNISADNSKPLKIVNHKMDVDSAYFSPSGTYLATTSQDNRVGLLTGVNYEDLTMIDHHNWNPTMESSSRAIWGWDDSYLFTGNMNMHGGVDVISTAQRKKIATLRSAYMYPYPYHLAAHPYNIGILAGAALAGTVSVWTTF